MSVPNQIVVKLGTGVPRTRNGAAIRQRRRNIVTAIKYTVENFVTKFLLVIILWRMARGSSRDDIVN
jgi:hypothetical protein